MLLKIKRPTSGASEAGQFVETENRQGFKFDDSTDTATAAIISRYQVHQNLTVEVLR